MTCRRTSIVGCGRCRRRSPRLSADATATACRSASLRSPTPASSIARQRAARGLSARSPTSSISGAPTRSRSCSDARSPARPPASFKGVAPVIQAHYKHSKVKQYFKDGRALRTETTVNDPYDFGVNRTLSADTWGALLKLGHDVNTRLMAAQLAACQCAPDPAALQAVVLPSTTTNGQHAPGLRFGDPRVMALLACLCHYGHLFNGLTNRSLRELVAELIPGYSPRHMTYDLRRLRRKGLIRRVARSQRYELTDHGRMIAVFFTKTHTRIVNPSLAELDPQLPDTIARRSPLARSWRDFERALDHRIKQAAIAA